MSVLLTIGLGMLAAAAEPRPGMVVVVGAAGTPEYDTAFRRWADLWQTAAKKGGVACALIGREPEAGTTDRERLRAFLAGQAQAGSAPLWVVLIQGVVQLAYLLLNLGPRVLPARPVEPDARRLALETLGSQ